MASEILTEISERLSYVLWIQPASIVFFSITLVALYKGVLANKNSTISALKDGVIPGKDSHIKMLRDKVEELEKKQPLSIVAEANRAEEEFTKSLESRALEIQKLRSERDALKKTNLDLEQKSLKEADLEAQLHRSLNENKSMELVFEAKIKELYKPIYEAQNRLTSMTTHNGDKLVSTGADSTAERVRFEVEKHLQESGSTPDFQAVADSLHKSTQGLRRRLTVEGYSFQELVSQVKRDFAIYWITEKKSIEEVSKALGYEEISTFYRQFKTWTGLTPEELQST